MRMMIFSLKRSLKRGREGQREREREKNTGKKRKNINVLPFFSHWFNVFYLF